MKTYYTDDFKEWAGTLRAGEEILLSGTVYTARDAAHKRIAEALRAGASLPFDLNSAFIYYAGPTPAKNTAVGACGPTTSSRMDPYAPDFYARGLAATIGKGDRSRRSMPPFKNTAASICAQSAAQARSRPWPYAPVRSLHMKT